MSAVGKVVAADLEGLPAFLRDCRTSKRTVETFSRVASALKDLADVKKRLPELLKASTEL
jgi:hypothetical protein